MKITHTSRSLAKEVIAGKWGNNAERVERLTAAGYDYNHIQDVVNEMYINGEVDEHGNVIEKETEKTKEIEIDMRGYDSLAITLVVD